MHTVFTACAHHYTLTLLGAAAAALVGILMVTGALIGFCGTAREQKTRSRAVGTVALCLLSAGMVGSAITVVHHVADVRESLVRVALVDKYAVSIEKFGVIPDDSPRRSTWILNGHRHSCQLSVGAVSDPVLTCTTSAGPDQEPPRRSQ